MAGRPRRDDRVRMEQPEHLAEALSGFVGLCPTIEYDIKLNFIDAYADCRRAGRRRPRGWRRWLGARKARTPSIYRIAGETLADHMAAAAGQCRYFRRRPEPGNERGDQP